MISPTAAFQFALRSHEKKAISRFRGMDQQEVLMLTMMLFLGLANQSVEPSFYFLKETNFARASGTRAWFSGAPIAIDSFPKRIRIKVEENLAKHCSECIRCRSDKDYDGSIYGNVNEEIVEFFREFLSINNSEPSSVGPSPQQLRDLNDWIAGWGGGPSIP